MKDVASEVCQYAPNTQGLGSPKLARSACNGVRTFRPFKQSADAGTTSVPPRRPLAKLLLPPPVPSRFPNDQVVFHVHVVRSR